MGLSKTEVNGMLVLFPLTIFFLFVPSIYLRYFGIDYSTYESDKRLLDSLVQVVEEATFKEKASSEPIPAEHFVFNPNEVSVDDMVRLGFPAHLSDRVDNYRKAGGRFKVRNDLKRIYGFPDSLYFILEPYIDLPEKPVKLETETKNRTTTKKKTYSPIVESNEEEEVVIVDITSADTTELKKIKGIGSSYARRIVGYRKLLGGYSEINQLKEVYGFSDSLFSILKSNFTVSDTVILKRIPINLASFKMLNRHPYISYEQTKDILNTKSKSGKFRSVEDLYSLSTFDSAQVLRLAPYLDFR